MYLNELLDGICSLPKQNPFITGLCQNSFRLKKGDLFFAYPGLQFDGRDFLTEVIEKGASAVLFEPDANRLLPATSIPLMPIAHLNRYLGLIASRFFGYPSQSVSVIGITGTNGKTSCTHFLAQCMQQLHHPSGVIGTLGNGLYPSLEAGALTTPDAIELQRLVSTLSKNTNTVFMEVSSHSLAQHRLHGTEFFLAALTNLTRDHLDYHINMREYTRAKRSFFDLPGVKQAVLNANDPYGQVWLEELAGSLPVIGYSLENVPTSLAHIPCVIAKNYQFYRQGFQADIETPWGKFPIKNSFLIGKFNLSNILLVITILKILGFSLTDIAEVVGNLKGIRGRMEAFHNSNKALVVVDYAHTPDALEQALITLREHTQGNLYCVFGCGGDRDKGKRPLMAAVAERLADYLILTNDNPRFEEPASIIQAMQQGLSNTKPIYIEQDRQLAISYAIQKAKKEDVVLVAGKGHEEYQLIAGIKYPFCDIQVVKDLLDLA